MNGVDRFEGERRRSSSFAVPAACLTTLPLAVTTHTLAACFLEPFGSFSQTLDMESGAEGDSVDIGTVSVADDAIMPCTPQRRRPPALNLRHTSSFTGPTSPTAQEHYIHKSVKSPGHLTRSNTLPRNYLKTPSKESPAHPVLQEVPSLQLESETISKLASWIVCVALGM